MAEAEEILGELKGGDGGSNVGSHLKTYTAGEDGSRLANAAKEFGLANQRKPRKQVRDRSKKRPSILATFPRRVFDTMFDPTMEDIRMRSVYTSHGEIPHPDADDDDFLIVERMPSWLGEIDDFGDERVSLDAEGGDVDFDDHHGGGIGGSLFSAVLGIIKGMFLCLI